MSGNNTAVRVTMAICATVIIVVALCSCSFIGMVFLSTLGNID